MNIYISIFIESSYLNAVFKTQKTHVLTSFYFIKSHKITQNKFRNIIKNENNTKE